MEILLDALRNASLDSILQNNDINITGCCIELNMGEDDAGYIFEIKSSQNFKENG